MNPLTMGMDIVGMGLQIFGAFGAADAAKHKAEIEKQVAGAEQGINEQKRQQMEFEARRMQMEVFRNMQRQRAMATAAAVNQGASTGSGLQGGLAQVTDKSLTNSLGISGNLQFGRTIFGLNDQISGLKMQMADANSDQAQAQAWASLGGAMVNNAGKIGDLGSNFAKMFG